MKHMRKTLMIVSVLAMAGCGSRNDLECSTENGEIFSLNRDGERLNAKEACTCMQIRMFETATKGFADETQLRDDYGC